MADDTYPEYVSLRAGTERISVHRRNVVLAQAPQRWPIAADPSPFGLPSLALGLRLSGNLRRWGHAQHSHVH